MKRGEIYYVAYDGGWSGHEIQGGRPAVVISNDLVNQRSQLVTVVYLTSTEKETMYTRPKITSSGRISWAICEQVSTITVKKVENYCGMCTKEEMESIEDSVRFHLSLQQEEKKVIKEDKKEDNNIELLKIKTERDTYKSMYENLLKSLVPTR